MSYGRFYCNIRHAGQSFYQNPAALFLLYFRFFFGFVLCDCHIFVRNCIVVDYGDLCIGQGDTVEADIVELTAKVSIAFK